VGHRRWIAVAVVTVGALLISQGAAMADPAPPFSGSVTTLDQATRARMIGVTWFLDCPVSLDDLRAVTLTYWGLDNAAHTGTLVVNQDAADQMVTAFRNLYNIRFPISSMTPIEAFGGDDDASVAADNTSAFNCRTVAGTTSWSEHAYGRAVDINPCRNPYVVGGHVKIPHCQRFADRSASVPGEIHDGDWVVQDFASLGWGWGGHFRTSKDYQHFSANGR
jgi:hypothetical protein